MKSHGVGAHFSVLSWAPETLASALPRHAAPLTLLCPSRPRRSGSRTDAPSGRSARRPPTCSVLRGRSCRRTTACRSSRPLRRQQRPWATASAPFTPTTPAGPRQGCPACRSCSSRRRWAASRPWPSPCPSAAWVPGHRPTPWVYPTCRPTAPGCSRTCTSPRSLGWFPPPYPAPPT